MTCSATHYVEIQIRPFGQNDVVIACSSNMTIVEFFKKKLSMDDPCFPSIMIQGGWAGPEQMSTKTRAFAVKSGSGSFGVDVFPIVTMNVQGEKVRYILLLLDLTLPIGMACWMLAGPLNPSRSDDMTTLHASLRLYFSMIHCLCSSTNLPMHDYR